jgi:hypothetical protein
MNHNKTAAWLRQLVVGLDETPTEEFQRGYQAALRDVLAAMDGRPRPVPALTEPPIGISHTARLLATLR